MRLKNYWLTVAAVICCLWIAGCSGTSGTTNSNSPTPTPTPTFNSTAPAPTAAVAGIPYSYALSATDPAGGTITFALTAGPAGASLSGNTITWTPTAQQTGANNFTVTATSSAGGTNTESWTVTVTAAPPVSRTVTGSYIDTQWTANGKVTEPVSGFTVTALVPQPDGTFSSIPGTVNASTGTFTIDNVPVGYYWLSFGPSSTPDMYWTNSSTFDRGSDFIGRPVNSSTQANTNFSVSLTGLNAWAAGDLLWFGSPNAEPLSWLSAIPPLTPPIAGSTSVVGAVTANVTPINAGQGDVSYAIQYVKSTAFAPSVTAATAGPALTLSNFTTSSGTNPLAGTLTASSLTSVDLNIKGSAWDSMFTNNVGPAPWGPGVEVGFSSYVYVQPYTTGNTAASWGGPLASALFGPINEFETDAVRVGPYAGNRLYLAWLMDNGTKTVVTDVDLGQLTYSDPFATNNWPTIFATQLQWQLQVPGSSTQILLSEGYAGTTVPSAGSPIAPQISPVQNLKLNNTLITDITTPVPAASTLSWSAPATGNATGYHVQVIKITNTKKTFVADLYSPTTSITLPNTLLHSSTKYVFVVEALKNSNPASNMATSPWKVMYPTAFSQAVSDVITVQ